MLIKNFRHVTIKPIRRELNSRVDGLAKSATTVEYKKKTKLIMMEDMTEGKGPESDKGDDGMREIIEFL